MSNIPRGIPSRPRPVSDKKELDMCFTKISAKWGANNTLRRIDSIGERHESFPALRPALAQDVTPARRPHVHGRICRNVERAFGPRRGGRAGTQADHGDSHL